MENSPAIPDSLSFNIYWREFPPCIGMCFYQMVIQFK